MKRIAIAVACGFAFGCGVPGLARAQPLPGAPRLEAPFDATPQEAVERMLKLGKAGPNDLVCDLGCGDARLPITAARLYGSRGLGVDIDPARVADSIANAQRNKVSDRVEIREGDLFKQDLSEVNLLTLYLLPRMLGRLRPQLQQLPIGARVVTYVFPIPGLRPHKVEMVSSERGEYPIYLYRVPLVPDYADPWYTPPERAWQLIQDNPVRFGLLALTGLYAVWCVVRFSGKALRLPDGGFDHGRIEYRAALLFWTFVPPLAFLLDLYVFHSDEARSHIEEIQRLPRLIWLAVLGVIVLLARR